MTPEFLDARRLRAVRQLHAEQNARGVALRTCRHSTLSRRQFDVRKNFYFADAVVWPSLRRRSCNLARRAAGVFGLNATRYHSGWLRSFASAVSVAESAFGWRATFSRIAA